MIVWAKVGGILAAVLLCFGAGFYFGGLKSKTALEAQHAAQLQAVVTLLQTNASLAAADHQRMQGIIDAYDANKDLPDPIVVNLGQRVLNAQAGTCRRDLPEAGAVASGTQAPAAQPAGYPDPKRLSELIQSVFDTAHADAEQMKAMVLLAP